jgi:O-antigen/teichoic acid export membrane protein
VKRRFNAIKSSIAFVALFQAIFSFSIAAIFFVFSNQIALAVFGTEAAAVPLKILSAWFFVVSFYYPLSFAFRSFQNFSAYASMELLWITFILLAAILFVGVFGQGVGGVASAYLVATLIIIIFGLAYFGKRYPQVLKEKVMITKPLVKKLFGFALPVFFYGLGGLIIGYMDILMITVFRTIPEVGIYQAAQPTAHLLWCLVGTVAVVLFPMVSELWARREKKLLGDALHFLTKFSFVLIIPAALGFIAFPEIIIRLFFGANYLAGAMVLQILSVAAIAYTLYKILGCAISGIGKPLIVTKVFAVMACLNFVGNLLLIPPYGIEGAAGATLCSFVLGFFLLLHYARKFVRFPVPSLPLLKTLVGGMLTLFLIFGLKSVIVLPPWPEAFAVLIPSMVFYGIWLLTTKAITKDDLRLINRVVPMPGWLIRLAGRFIRG